VRETPDTHIVNHTFFICQYFFICFFKFLNIFNSNEEENTSFNFSAKKIKTKTKYLYLVFVFYEKIYKHFCGHEGKPIKHSLSKLRSARFVCLFYGGKNLQSNLSL